MRPALITMTDLFNVRPFEVVFSWTADFGIRMTTGTKPDGLRTSSGILSAGIETRSLSKNSAEVELSSLGDCPVLILAVIELPLCLYSALRAADSDRHYHATSEARALAVQGIAEVGSNSLSSRSS